MPTTTKTSKSKPNVALPNDESASAEASFLLLAPRHAQIPRDRIATVNVDVQVAAVFALGVSQLVSEPSVRKLFNNLAKSGEYSDSCVDDLEVAARAAWFTRHKLLLSNATRSEAQLPLHIIDEAYALRTRMLKLAEYWLSDDVEQAAEISAIRAGSGYQDLANDLLALAAMLERNDAELAQDKKLYRAGDAAEARTQADRILRLLGTSITQEQSQWTERQARAWTFLLDVYEEVRRGGRFLFAGNSPDQRFPSLTAVARTPSAGRGTKEGISGAGEEQAPADPPPPPA